MYLKAVVSPYGTSTTASTAVRSAGGVVSVTLTCDVSSSRWSQSMLLHTLSLGLGLTGREQSDKISHIDMEDNHSDNVISHIISPYTISLSKLTISISDIVIGSYLVTLAESSLVSKLERLCLTCWLGC